MVIPCLNEARSIGICVEKALEAFQEIGIRGEVVVADNGSTDGSAEIAEKLGARVVHVATRGYGNALRKGIEEAKGEFIIMGDADDSYDFSQVPGFVAKWREGSELVMGNRFEGGIKPGAMPWLHKYLGNPALTAILNSFFHAGIGDAYCGMRGFTKRVYEQVDPRTTGWSSPWNWSSRRPSWVRRSQKFRSHCGPTTRTQTSPADLPRRLAQLALHAALRAQLALPASRNLSADGWPGTGFLAFPRAAAPGHVTIDVHTMLFGMIFALLGAQVISIGLFAKVFSYAERFSQNQRSLERWLRRVKLEDGLVLGGTLAFSGAGGAFWLLWKWAASDFGPFDQVRSVIVFSLLLFLGVQVIFSSFFISMLGISRGTYIGDYDGQNH